MLAPCFVGNVGQLQRRQRFDRQNIKAAQPLGRVGDQLLLYVGKLADGLDVERRMLAIGPIRIRRAVFVEGLTTFEMRREPITRGRLSQFCIQRRQLGSSRAIGGDLPVAARRFLLVRGKHARHAYRAR